MKLKDCCIRCLFFLFLVKNNICRLYKYNIKDNNDSFDKEDNDLKEIDFLFERREKSRKY